VATRWSHIEIVIFFLENLPWEKEDIKRSLQHVKEESAENEIKARLKDYAKRSYGSFYACCFLADCLL